MVCSNAHQNAAHDTMPGAVAWCAGANVLSFRAGLVVLGQGFLKKLGDDDIQENRRNWNTL